MKSRIRRLLLFSLDTQSKLQSGVAVSSARHRYKGQALLLAVVIMLFAALLGAGFLAVVSGNLNQSARIADKTRAIEASRAGIAFANAQLSSSSQGDLWRPIDVSPAPAPGSVGYDFTYSQLDKVQGWANTKVAPLRNNYANETAYQIALKSYRDGTYGKFPDPNQAVGDAPKFLVKVEEVPLDSPTESSHGGEIKITSIGLSDDDPNVFHRAIAYKSGRRKSPWANALRSISNWHFGDTAKNTGVAFATDPQIVNAATIFPANLVEFTVDVADKPAFSSDNVPFNVVIVKKDAAPSVRGAVVTKVENQGSKLTFARLEATIGANETIQKAAALGIGSTIDLLNTGTPAPYAADLPQPGGIMANGSIWLQGQIRLSNLSKNGTRIRASGTLAIDATDADKKPVLENSGDIGPTNGADASSNKVVASSQTNFPGNLVLTSAAASNGVKTTDLVNDGWDKIGAQTLGLDYSGGRDVTPFVPAQIDSPKNLARYRALTRNSAGGVYIDNRDDIERINGRIMTQAELIEMLISPNAAPKDYERTGVAALAGATNVSLEQRHLRGWVGPDEFLARGALVELVQVAGANPHLRVTLDARSDANPNGPDANKTFRDASGAPSAGVYTRDFEWPRNGTVMAEGDLRIRGDVNLSNLTAGTDAANFPSLTVVALGNIYIEGSLSVDSKNNSGTDIPVLERKKLMLLARKNVIVNPTRAVLARTDVQTIATNMATITLTANPAAPKDLKIPVADVLAFNKGDLAEVTTTVPLNPIRGLVTLVDLNAKILTINTASSGTIPISTIANPVIVRSPLEKRQAGDAPSSDRLFFSLVNAESAINRRFVAATTQDASPNRSRIIFDHIGDLQGTAGEGINIKAEDFDAAHQRPSDFTAVLTNKQPLDSSGKLDLDATQPNVQKTDKFLRTYQNFSTPELKDFNDLVAPSAAKPLSQLRLEIMATPESREMPNPEGYRYVANLTNSALATLSAHALAGVGLRYQPGKPFVAPADSPTNQRRADFNSRTQSAGFTIPLATSVEYDLNGVLANLLPNSQARLTQYVGFDPKQIGTEDTLTVDNSFYQFKTEIFKSTLDSRVLTLLASNPKLTSFPQSLVMKRTIALSGAATSSLLPDYRVRSIKLENTNLTDRSIKPVAEALQINAFVYAQQGSWLVIPGDYFRSNPPVRGIADNTGKIIGSYIDYDNSKTVQANEYILRDPNDAASAKIADLNRNGKYDGGEIEAALRFTRYNLAPIQFTGAIAENQTAVVADAVAVAANAPPIVTGAVQNWTDKWATYDDSGANNNDVGKPGLFKFIAYNYDLSLAIGSPGANELRVPVTDELIYQQ